MKKLLAILVGIAVLSVANVSAEPDVFEKPLLCDDVKVIFESLKNDYNETPIWLGNSSSSKITLFVNEQTKTWTLVEFNNKTGCILGTGVKSNQIIIPTT